MLAIAVRRRVVAAVVAFWFKESTYKLGWLQYSGSYGGGKRVVATCAVSAAVTVVMAIRAARWRGTATREKVGHERVGWASRNGAHVWGQILAEIGNKIAWIKDASFAIIADAFPK